MYMNYEWIFWLVVSSIPYVAHDLHTYMYGARMTQDFLRGSDKSTKGT